MNLNFTELNNLQVQPIKVSATNSYLLTYYYKIKKIHSGEEYPILLLYLRFLKQHLAVMLLKQVSIQRVWKKKILDLPVTLRKLKSANPFPTEFCQIASNAGIIGETSVPLARKPSLVKSFAIST